MAYYPCYHCTDNCKNKYCSANPKHKKPAKAAQPKPAAIVKALDKYEPYMADD